MNQTIGVIGGSMFGFFMGYNYGWSGLIGTSGIILMMYGMLNID